MPAIDTSALISNIQSAASKVIGQDIATLKGFSTQQLSAIAQQSAMVAAGIVDGSISGDLQTYFLDNLKEMARAFVNVLAGMVAVMIEATWNAIVGVIWGAINKATGLSLVVP